MVDTLNPTTNLQEKRAYALASFHHLPWLQKDDIVFPKEDHLGSINEGSGEVSWSVYRNGSAEIRIVNNNHSLKPYVLVAYVFSKGNDAVIRHREPFTKSQWNKLIAHLEIIGVKDWTCKEN